MFVIVYNDFYVCVMAKSSVRNFTQSNFVPTKSMLAKTYPYSPELNTLAILSG